MKFRLLCQINRELYDYNPNLVCYNQIQKRFLCVLPSIYASSETYAKIRLATIWDPITSRHQGGSIQGALCNLRCVAKCHRGIEGALRWAADSFVQKCSAILAGRYARFLCRPMLLKLRRETGVSRHHGGPIEGPSEISWTSQHYGTEGFRGAINWAPIIPRGVSISDSRSNFW